MGTGPEKNSGDPLRGQASPPDATFRPSRRVFQDRSPPFPGTAAHRPAG